MHLCNKHRKILYKGRCTYCDQENKDAEARGRENYYADYELKDNPYPKDSMQFIAWAFGHLDAQDNQTNSAEKL